MLHGRFQAQAHVQVFHALQIDFVPGTAKFLALHSFQSLVTRCDSFPVVNEGLTSRGQRQISNSLHFMLLVEPIFISIDKELLHLISSRAMPIFSCTRLRRYIMIAVETSDHLALYTGLILLYLGINLFFDLNRHFFCKSAR